MMTIDDILQDLIEGGLLLDWSTPKGEKFSFRVDGRENVTYTLILSRKKTPFQEKGSKEEQWIIRLESKFTGAKERVKPFCINTLIGQNDWEEIYPWVMYSILARQRYNRKISRYVRAAKLKMIEGQYCNSIDEVYRVLEYKGWLVFLYSGKNELVEVYARKKSEYDKNLIYLGNDKSLRKMLKKLERN